MIIANACLCIGGFVLIDQVSIFFACAGGQGHGKVQNRFSFVKVGTSIKTSFFSNNCPCQMQQANPSIICMICWVFKDLNLVILYGDLFFRLYSC